MKLTEQQINSLYGQDVRDRSGAKIGTVAQIWVDSAGEPTWVSVKSGIMDRKMTLAPLGTARMEDGRLSVPYDKDKVKHAPSVEHGTERPLDSGELSQLYAYYQLGEQPAAPAPTAGAPTGQEELIRSEERLRVGTESEPAGTAHLSRHVVTDDVHTTVPVEHDEVRIEREPITAQNRGDVRPEMTDAEREMTLRAERPVVSKEQVPVERVRMVKDEVTDDRSIDDRVRREEIEADVPETVRRGSAR